MWWQYIVIAVGLLFLIYAISVVAGFNTRILTRKTDRTAQDMYDQYADTGYRRHLLGKRPAHGSDETPPR
jgi:hypothetical protein